MDSNHDYLRNPLTNNQNELVNISGAKSGLTNEDFVKGIHTATEQIFLQQPVDLDVLTIIANAHATLLASSQNTEGILLSTHYAVRKLLARHSDEEISAFIEGLASSDKISPEFDGLVMGILREMRSKST